MTSPHPQLVSVKLEKLRPTQITVGKQEVALKRKEWEKLNKRARTAALERHWFPAISGPEGNHYIVDHHHFGLALMEEDVKSVSLLVLKDLSFVEPARFWTVMDHHQWVHPYDADGVRCKFDMIPKRLEQLRDDPYRSLAGELRRAGGYAKDVTPFSEFLWADFFRSRISRTLLKDNFAKAMIKAMKLGASQDARYLPGWTGLIVG
ncbi:ParB-like protein [Glaciimonas sp. PAMC28666]|uniref:ParB-like protein n=1 Tax=Glaciimonas sp. PAMC28666 TaxID=2807626 RepID=UPI0019664069|nr:ParB-like protein [Glaciimonas sp. PAMC28666]QRX83626.1 chromosome partitioning protein ParB [Glaciimonas sp. PAMC28666]